MVLIDPDALDELALDLQAWTRTIHNASEPAATQLGTIGRGDLAGALAQHLAEAGAALELLASDLASRAASMRATEAMLIAHVSALTEPRPARSTSIPEARPVREVWQGLRRLHRLRPAVEHLKRLGLTAPGDAVEAAVARLTSELTVADWQQITLLEAGLDGLDWRPSHGLAANDAAVQGVYNFYARLQLDNVDFQWAGMAATVGAAFYAGWQDLHAVRRLSDDARRWFLSRLTGPIPGTGIVAIPIRPGVVAQVSAAELQWLEVRMLSMQKEIFDDLAWMHVAYRYGGLAALLPRLTGPAYANARRAWIDIASGDPERVAAGNALLLRREQLEIIQDDYDEIRAHNGPSGESITRLLTWTATSSIPGSRPYREVVTQIVQIPMVGFDEPELWPPWEIVPAAYEPVVLTLPRGNIADFEHRWEWIESELLPAYLALHARPKALQDLLTVPVSVRAEEQRTLPLLPYPGG